MNDSDFVERTDPEEVFTVLASDTRVEIIQALWNADALQVTFSELHSASDVRDSGQFNYHLEKLRGLFVRKTADENYELTEAGRQIIGAIEAGSYTVDASIEPLPLEESCLTCGGELTFEYEDEVVSVECGNCSLNHQFPVPPSVFSGYEREEFPEVASRYLMTDLQRIDRGFCSYCDSRIDPSVEPIVEFSDDFPDELSEAIADERAIEDVPIVTYTCQQCGAHTTSSLSLSLLNTTAVSRLYYNHDIEPHEVSMLEFTSLTVNEDRIRSTDPFRASATFELEEDVLTVVVDENLDVVETETE